MNQVYIYDAVRTPRGRGKSSGALHEVRPISLLALCLEAIRSRNQLDPNLVNDCIAGCVTPIMDQGANIAKAALLYAHWPDSVSGMQVNRFCASGLEAIHLAVAKIAAGHESLILAGGVESMSRVPMESDGGALLFDPEVNVRTDYIPQGISADLIATKEGYSREMLDRYALQSQARCHAAQKAGYFNNSIIPVKDQNGLSILEADEHPRPTTTLAQLSKLPGAFAKIGAQGFDAMALRRFPEVEKIWHLHTAGNSSGIVDGAALVLLGDEAMGQTIKQAPRGRIVSVANVSSDPVLMLEGPAPAAKLALQRAKLDKSDIDLWEMNEAFAAPLLKFQQTMDIPNELLNVNGGAIAMGHPLGATGAMIFGTLLDELERRKKRYGLVTLCVGGGMGIATIIERI